MKGARRTRRPFHPGVERNEGDTMRFSFTRRVTSMFLLVCATLASEACGGTGSTTTAGTGGMETGGSSSSSGGGSSCGTGTTDCDGACVDTSLDPKNCGACGKACAEGELCSVGTCGVVCLGGTTQCGDACKDTAIDTANCGACGHACPAGNACVGGECQSAGCTPGQTLCTVGDKQTCTRLNTDRQNCGGCGFVCPEGDVCSRGQCGSSCIGKTSTLCGDGCVDTASDNLNCGACGNACPAGQVCTKGACAATCAVNDETCGSGTTAYCASTHDDPQNCGACGAVCPAGQLCSNGTCAPHCSGALDTSCNGLCVDPSSDKHNCGACGNVCPGTQVCSGGQCSDSCATGYTSCGSGAGAHCTALDDDPQNCGACDHACPLGQGCSQGTCAPACNGIKGTSCGGLCTNLINDPANCGSCGFKCAAGDVCSGGLCVKACDQGTTACTAGTITICADTSIDPQNCGACGTACPAGKVCSNGTCGDACQTGYDTCGTGPSAFCTQTDTDPSNCGGCGHACAPPAHGSITSCTLGACGFTCNAGYATTNNGNTCLSLTGISSGVYHTCGLTSSGGVMCWGQNYRGQLGDGTKNNHLSPVTVLGLSGPAVKVAVGSYSTCAALANGSVECWGQNDYGELGNSTMTESVVPVAVPNLTGVADIHSGTLFSCVLTNAGGVACWGFNAYGQLGDGSFNNSSSPVMVSGLSSGVAAIAVGRPNDVASSHVGAHACAVTTAGALRCWGANSSGQLGDGSFTTSNTPVAVLGLSSGIAAVAAGSAHSCALTTMGAVDCWGLNANGQLGNGGTIGGHTTYGPVTGLSSGVVAIASGGSHTCALTQAKKMLCWGANGYGAIGDGTFGDQYLPTAVVGLPPGGVPTVVKMGLNQTFAETSSGALLGWGYNANGQLGDGTTLGRAVPAPIQ
ncbi:BNR repeat domain protein [Minicystis rosea]|nr:BNR repeat domain protein [Minicystis rosea]